MTRMTSNVLAIPVLLLIGSVLSGCGMSFMSHRGTNPVIQDEVLGSGFGPPPVSVFATTAERRTVLVRIERDSNKAISKVLMCAEPSPDVGEAISSSIVAKATAQSSTSATLDSQAALEYGRQVATSIAPLIYRSQGLQYLRDTQYAYCLDYLNGALDAKAYVEHKDIALKRAGDLIVEEIKAGGFGAKAVAAFGKLDAPSTADQTKAPPPTGAASSEARPGSK